MTGCSPWLLLLVALAVASCRSLGGAEPAVRFDGDPAQLEAHFKGFQKDAVPAGWQAVDGTITLVEPGCGDLVTRETFRDFELTLEWRITPRGNSGIMFHVSEAPEFEQTYVTGPEMQVLDNVNAKGDLSVSAGANYALHAPTRDATRPVGEWNAVRIHVEDGRVRQWLNGELQCDYVLGSEDWLARVAASKFASMPGYGVQGEGHVALQDHGNVVSYRDVAIRRL